MYITYIDKKTGKANTRSVETITEKNSLWIDNAIPSIYKLYEEAQKILSDGDLSKRYRTKYIPKQSGGKRRIDKPDEELKKYMRKVINVFVNELHLVFPQSSYAYIKNRSPKQLAETHKEARTIIRLDIKRFFYNCTLEFIMAAMEEVYPFCLLDITVLEVIIKACMLKYDDHYGLPQGAPTSPILSNIAMIPIDYELDACYPNYNRYADDIFLSYKKGQSNKSIEIISSNIQNILRRYNNRLILNKDKSTSINIMKTSGAWVLGMVVNQDHNVTIGSKTKQRLKAKVFSFLMDAKNGNSWEKQNVYKLIGLISYYKYIEPQYVDMIIQKYEEKTGMNYHEEIENIIYS